MASIVKYCLLVGLALVLVSCTLEQKLARTFVKQPSAGTFLLLEPDVVFKSNLKTFELDSTVDYDDYTRDSLLMEKSIVLKELRDSLLIDRFAEGFKQYLGKTGAIILPESKVDSLLESGGHPYIVNLAQYSVEEFLHPYSEEQYVYDEVLVIEGFDVNALAFNIWMELGQMNSEFRNRVLFHSAFMTDQVNGVMRQHLLSGKYYFDFTIDTMNTAGAYDFAKEFGMLTAARFYDYLLNRYVRVNLPEDYPYEPNYYHWDPDRKLFFMTDESERIMVLDESR